MESKERGNSQPNSGIASPGEAGQVEMRELVALTDHILYYRDDPLKLLYRTNNIDKATGEKTLNSLKFCSRVFAQDNMSKDEQSIIDKYRIVSDPLFQKTQIGVEQMAWVINDMANLAQKYVPKEQTEQYIATLLNVQINPPAEPEKQEEAKEEVKQAEPTEPALNVPKSREEAIAKKNKEMKPQQSMNVASGSELQLAKTLGMPTEIADMFFMKIDGKPYIKNPGLLYLGKKIGYMAIQTTDAYDEQTQLWVAETKIYPVLSVAQIEAVAKLAPEQQKVAIEALTRPTIATGTAGKGNVQNTRMHPFLREMAQTRSQNRALRPYTGYGGTSYEEMPTAEIAASEVN